MVRWVRTMANTVHTSERAFSCEVCNRKSTQLSKLMRHYHTGEGRFNLNVCDKKCRKLSALVVHRCSHSYCEQIQKHIHEHACELSGDIFVWKQTSRSLGMKRYINFPRRSHTFAISAVELLRTSDCFTDFVSMQVVHACLSLDVWGHKPWETIHASLCNYII